MEYPSETQEAVAQHYASYLHARHGIKTVLGDLVHRRIPLFIGIMEINRHLNQIRDASFQALGQAVAARRES